MQQITTTETTMDRRDVETTTGRDVGPSDTVVWTETSTPIYLPFKAEAIYRGLRLTVEVTNGYAIVNVWVRLGGIDLLAYAHWKMTVHEAKVAAQDMADRLLAAGAEPRGA